MCARFTLTVPNLDAVAAALRASVHPGVEKFYRRRFNIAPAERHWIVRADREVPRRLVPADWGFVPARRDPGVSDMRPINARSETAATRSIFREAFVSRRCIVPADGFFEWTGPRRARRPLWFHHPDGALLRMAGLWARVIDSSGRERECFAILTAPARGAVREIHDRMPVLLDDAVADAWIGAPGECAEREEIEALLAGRPIVPLKARPVSRRINRPGVDGDPTLLETVVESEAQGSLF